MKIRNKLVAIIIPIFFAIMMISYLGSINSAKKILDSEVSERILAVKEIQKASIEKNMNSARQIATDVATVVSNTYQHKDIKVYENILGSIVNSNSFILGVGIWFEPYAYDNNEKYVGPYVFKDLKKITTTYEYSNEKYNYFIQEFYALAKEQGQMIFTDIYFDDTSNLYMMTCSQPILDTAGQFIGCITVDIEMSTMQDLIADYNTRQLGLAYIINHEGTYLSAENIELVRNKRNIVTADNEDFQAVASRILTEQAGEANYISNKQRIKVYYDTLNELEWKIVFEIPDKIIHQPLYELSQLFAIIFGISLLFLVFSIYLISMKDIDKPVKLLLKELESIGSNTFETDFNKEIKSRNDEFGLIGKSLQSMKSQLSQYQKDLQDYLEENIAANEELSQQNEELIETERIINSNLQYSNSLIEAIPNPVFVISKDGIFLDCKGDSKDLFMSREAFIGKSMLEILPTNIGMLGMNAINEIRLTGKTQKIEYEWTQETESEYHELHLAPWFDDKVVAITRNITETRNYIREIEYVGYHDKLTGLYNRSYFDKQLRVLDTTGNYPICIILSGLNGLKMINDSFGHQQGDAMLQKYASILCETIGGDPLISRISGDEFAVVLYHTSEQETKKCISEVVKKCSMERINGIDLSVAFGYSVLDDETLSIQIAMKKAEDHMYQNKLYESSSRRSKTIDIILSTLHEKNPREEKHSRRVAELCENMALKMKLSDEEVKRIRTAGILHDIGKIGIQEDLLNKPSSLSHEEYIEICKHSEIGYRILNTAPNMSEISEIVLAHHERWDGKGYPKGIKGEEIPLYSRIIAIIDAYDAMTSDRSYRKALPVEITIEELKKNAGIQFDPNLTAFFIEYIA